MKTDRTLEIENKLKYYDPDTIGGFKINKFRRRNYAFEVPVTCGTISDGLIDFVRVDEILIPGPQSYCCNIGKHKEWYLKNNPEVLKYIGTPLGVEPAARVVLEVCSPLKSYLNIVIADIAEEIP